MTAIDEHPQVASVRKPVLPPPHRAKPAQQAATPRRAWRELALLAAVYLLYDLTRRLTMPDTRTAVANAHSVLHVEHLLRLSPEHWLNHAVSTRAFLALPADYAYATLHYVVTLVVLIWLWRAHPAQYLPARRVLMAATLLGLVGFALLPLAPPRMLPGFIDTMALYGHDGWWSGAASAPQGLGALTNQFAAMPSLHVGWATWCGTVVARNAHRRSVQVLAIAYPILIVLVVLSTANHYLLDAAGGLLVLAAGYAATRASVQIGLLHPNNPTIGST